MWLLYYSNFERSYDVLKTKSPFFLLIKIINFNKNEMESKMENRTRSFTEAFTEAFTSAHVRDDLELKVKNSNR